MIDVVAGLDIGGTNTAIGLVSRGGECMAEATISSRNHGPFADYVGRIAEQINRLTRQVEGANLLGIGVGAPNGRHAEGVIDSPPNLEWKGIIPIRAELQKHFPLPTEVINDAKAAALGEWLYGAGKGLRHFLVITLGTGLGCGIVSNGKLLMGADEQAGELGHTTVKPKGRMCGCGKRGCLETYASATGLCRTAIKLMANHRGNTMLSLYRYNELSARHIAAAALKGDQVALEAFERTGRVLGAKLADTVTTLNPEAIILAGGLSNAGDLLFEPTQRHMEENLFDSLRGRVKILPSGLKGNVAVLGAAVLIWKKFEPIHTPAF